MVMPMSDNHTWKLLNETMKMSKSVKHVASFSDGKSIIEKMKVGVELDPLLGI